MQSMPLSNSTINWPTKSWNHPAKKQLPTYISNDTKERFNVAYLEVENFHDELRVMKSRVDDLEDLRVRFLGRFGVFSSRWLDNKATLR